MIWQSEGGVEVRGLDRNARLLVNVRAEVKVVIADELLNKFNVMVLFIIVFIRWTGLMKGGSLELLTPRNRRAEH